MNQMFETNANALADVVNKIEALKTEKKAIVSDYNGRIAALEVDMFNLAEEIKKESADTLFENVTPEVVPNPPEPSPVPGDNESKEVPVQEPDANDILRHPMLLSAPSDTVPDDDTIPEINLGDSPDHPDNSFLESDLTDDQMEEEES